MTKAIAKTPIMRGDRVWFVSKFGDVVTGTYEGTEMRPYGTGSKLGHLVKSYDAFGHESTEPTNCLVFGALHKGDPDRG